MPVPEGEVNPFARSNGNRKILWAAIQCHTIQYIYKYKWKYKYKYKYKYKCTSHSCNPVSKLSHCSLSLGILSPPLLRFFCSLQLYFHPEHGSENGLFLSRIQSCEMSNLLHGNQTVPHLKAPRLNPFDYFFTRIYQQNPWHFATLCLDDGDGKKPLSVPLSSCGHLLSHSRFFLKPDVESLMWDQGFQY